MRTYETVIAGSRKPLGELSSPRVINLLLDFLTVRKVPSSNNLRKPERRWAGGLAFLSSRAGRESGLGGEPPSKSEGRRKPVQSLVAVRPAILS